MKTKLRCAVDDVVSWKPCGAGHVLDREADSDVSRLLRERVAMKERPIAFSGAMVMAILEGRKTMTRRVVKLPNWILSDLESGLVSKIELFDILKRGHRIVRDLHGMDSGQKTKTFSCPYGAPGDRLWVRESFTAWDASAISTLNIPESKVAVFRADGSCKVVYADGDVLVSDGPEADYSHIKKWKPSIHMPRWASRIMLEIVNVRVERLREITEKDAIAEGVSVGLGDYFDGQDFWTFPKEYTPIRSFKVLWHRINGKKHPWSSNPWVWVVEFKKVG